jgi:hypothetical protein
VRLVHAEGVGKGHNSGTFSCCRAVPVHVLRSVPFIPISVSCFCQSVCTPYCQLEIDRESQSIDSVPVAGLSEQPIHHAPDSVVALPASGSTAATSGQFGSSSSAADFSQSPRQGGANAAESASFDTWCSKFMVGDIAVHEEVSKQTRRGAKVVIPDSAGWSVDELKNYLNRVDVACIDPSGPRWVIDDGRRIDRFGFVVFRCSASGVPESAAQLQREAATSAKKQKVETESDSVSRRNETSSGRCGCTARITAFRSKDESDGNYYLQCGTSRQHKAWINLTHTNNDRKQHGPPSADSVAVQSTFSGAQKLRIGKMQHELHALAAATASYVGAEIADERGAPVVVSVDAIRRAQRAYIESKGDSLMQAACAKIATIIPADCGVQPRDVLTRGFSGKGAVDLLVRELRAHAILIGLRFFVKFGPADLLNLVENESYQRLVGGLVKNRHNHPILNLLDKSVLASIREHGLCAQGQGGAAEFTSDDFMSDLSDPARLERLKLDTFRPAGKAQQSSAAMRTVLGEDFSSDSSSFSLSRSQSSSSSSQSSSRPTAVNRAWRAVPMVANSIPAANSSVGPSSSSSSSASTSSSASAGTTVGIKRDRSEYI